jgi:hypothetical protein
MMSAYRRQALGMVPVRRSATVGVATTEITPDLERSGDCRDVMGFGDGFAVWAFGLGKALYTPYSGTVPGQDGVL